MQARWRPVLRCCCSGYPAAAGSPPAAGGSVSAARVSGTSEGPSALAGIGLRRPSEDTVAAVRAYNSMPCMCSLCRLSVDTHHPGAVSGTTSMRCEKSSLYTVLLAVPTVPNFSSILRRLLAAMFRRCCTQSREHALRLALCDKSVRHVAELARFECWTPQPRCQH